MTWRNVKKAVTTRWLILHASVDWVYDEYAGLLERLNILEGEGLRKDVEKIKFSWNVLHIEGNASFSYRIE